jgi:eukaryotic-like serine/threonine-protein kinase
MNQRVDRAQAYRIFSEALEMTPLQRSAYVRQHCAQDALLQQTVEELLAIASADPRTLGALRGEVEPALEDRTGWECGRFRLLELLGAGGMGAVYRAERTDGVPQVVAVKLLRGEISAARTERFLAEARILARMAHPAIAHLIDVGIREGAGWIAMEFVRGPPITDYCATQRLDTAARIGLLLTIADAISLAHRNLVVHRDIKPSNVLVTTAGHPKLIDFGIATALTTPPDAVLSEATDIGRLFTPHYAAPEQVRGEPATVLTDVFGLGALAYRLLSGVEPLAQATSALSYLHAVLHQDVALPSGAALAAGMHISTVRSLRGDLDCILMKALARDPARRYASVRDFADDLAAFLACRPASAHVPSAGYRLAKFVRRRSLAVGLTALLGASVLTGAMFYGLQARAVAQARNVALRRGEFLEELLKSADPSEGRRDVTVAELLTTATATAERKFASEPLIEASMLGVIAQTQADLGRYGEAAVANDRQLELLRTQGGGALEIGRALTVRGLLLRAQGQWPEAERVLKQALPAVRARGSPEDMCILLNMLGAAQSHTAEEAAAEATYREEIRIASAAGPALQDQLMLAYGALSALVGGEFGRYREAESYARRAWDIAQVILPADHPDRLIMENAYARALINVDQAAAAEALFRDAASAEEQVLGADHHDTLVTDLGLVEDLIELKRSPEAIELALPLAHRIDRVLGADNGYALTAWYDYGNAACDIHQDQAGLEALRHAEAGRLRLLPAEHRLIYSVRTGIGICLMHLHRYAEAEPLLLSAASGLERARGAQFRPTQSAFRALRDLYTAMDEPDKAASWAAKARS